VPEAAEQFARVVRLQPGHAEAHFNLGVAFARQKRFDEAAREFRQTLSLQPGHPSAGEMLQRALRLSGGEGG
jgi:Flp pilus assembly protein TadD